MVTIIILAALLGACSSTSKSMRLDSINRPPADPESVVILTEAPDQAHNVIGIVSANNRGNVLLASHDEMLSRLRQEAAKLGASGVIVDPPTHPVDDPLWSEVYEISGEAFVWVVTQE